MRNKDDVSRGPSTAQSAVEAARYMRDSLDDMSLDEIIGVVRESVEGHNNNRKNVTENVNLPSLPQGEAEHSETTASPESAALSPQELMRRVREEVKRRRIAAVEDTEGARDPVSELLSLQKLIKQVGEEMEQPGTTEEITDDPETTADTQATQEPLPPRTSALPELPLKSEYDLAEFLPFSDARFVDVAYKAILRRPPDPEGRSRFLSALRNGLMGKVEVLGYIRFSDEGKQKNIHVDGLLLPFKLHRWRRKAVIGRFIGFAVAVFRLPSLTAHMQAIEGNAARENQAVENFIDRNNEALEVRLNSNNEALKSHSTQLQRLATALEAQTQRCSNLEKVLDSAVSCIAAQDDNVASQRDSVNELTEKLHRSEERGRKLVTGLDETKSAIGTSQKHLQSQADQVEDIVSRVGAHDAAIKNLTIEGQGFHRNALKIQRQLIALLDRNMASQPGDPTDNAVSDAANKALAPSYVDLEDAFRGDRESVKLRAAPYLQTLAAANLKPADGLVLDLGCGRGEWLEVLTDKGYQCRGVDLNSAMVAGTIERGFDAVEADVVAYLREVPDASIAAVTAMHIVEHIPHNTLIRVLDEARRALIPGGVLILETPNPENLTVAAFSFYMDPTHRNPIPPQLLQWTVKERGFEEPEIQRLAVNRGTAHMERVPDGAPGAAQINQMIDWFVAAPDYAVVARKQTTNINGQNEAQAFHSPDYVIEDGKRE